MKQGILFFCSCLSLLLFSSWGFQPHKIINKHAVFTLPPEMSHFYKKNLYFIQEYAVNADKRVYIDPNESPRHFIDLDRIETNIDSIAIPWYKAKEKYTEKYLIARGIVPWQIEKSYQQLIQAFIHKNLKKIIKISADLGHYAADAHVPLHTTSNYNGQFTNQIGIHALWETRLPEKYFKEYSLLVGPAEYIDDVLGFSWKIVQESHSLLDSVLLIEKSLSQKLPKVLQRAYVQRGAILQNNYSDFYIMSYHQQLNGMVQSRIKKSIWTIGSLWYTAWVDAGQPNLSKIKIIPLEKDTIDLNVHNISKGRQEWH